ncbi:MAG: glycosyl hydrolase family 39 [Acidobacteriota bacterium]|nr:glycosyl hydrolase family 39 [Acidobacteriota bacterium]
MRIIHWRTPVFAGLALALAGLVVFGARQTRKALAADRWQTCTVTAHWDHVAGLSKTLATLQVVVNPPLRRGSPIHDRVFDALRGLGADNVRYVPWLPYPKLAVAELKPPANGKTSWNFSLIDPMMEDFMNATSGHPVIINFSTIPQWMFKTPKPVAYPDDPDQPVWNYEQGTELRDPSMKEVAAYYGRLASWYTRGGFKDEYGKEHASGHHYKIAYWEILNEVDFEHHMNPQFYTAIYDSIADAIHKADPQIKFVGMALADPSHEPQFFEYFLNHRNHKAGIPLNMISYHFYASPPADEPAEAWQYTFFDQASRFLSVVRYIQAIRQRLSPETKTDIDEIGAILPDDNVTPRGPIPGFYWNLCSSMYAYLYGNFARLGVDIAGESQLVGYPSQFPSVSMVNWRTGQPNARFWTLALLRRNLGPGDKLVDVHTSVPYVYAEGFITPGGERKILLANERNRPFDIAITGAAGGMEEYVDQTTGEHPPASVKLAGGTLQLGGFGVAIVTLPR